MTTYSALNQLHEGNLTSFDYSESNQRLELVLYGFFKEERGISIPVLVSFEKVKGYQRYKMHASYSSLHKDLSIYKNHFHTEEAGFTFLLQYTESTKFSHGFKVDLDFGSGVGGIRFTCSNYSFKQRSLRGQKVKGKWEYRDILTNEIVDDDYPFGKRDVSLD
jgi:hypothetical protein